MTRTLESFSQREGVGRSHVGELDFASLQSDECTAWILEVPVDQVSQLWLGPASSAGWRSAPRTGP